MANKFNFDRVIANLERVKNDVPKLLANETKNYFVKESFNKQEWNGVKWKDVKRRDKEGSSSNNSAILVQSGKLRRAVVNSLQSATFNKIHFEVKDVPYAQVHNEGLRAGRGAGFQMPKRQFMGQTKKLSEIQRAVIDKAINKIWQA